MLHEITLIEVKKIIGIYFLLNNGIIIYIGQSTNILTRVVDHSRNKIFTHYGYIECSEIDLNYLEKKMIQKYKPSLNKSLNADQKEGKKYVSVYNKETKRRRKYYSVFDIKKKYPHADTDKLERAFEYGHKKKYEDFLLIIF
jgi:excinuclease UvrABC nuclease subunit